MLKSTAARREMIAPEGSVGKPSATAHPRLLVGVGTSPLAAQLLKSAQEMAAVLGATWVAVNVETPYLLPKAEQRRLDEHLSFARELGAEIVITRDIDVVTALLRVAHDQHATHLLVGQSLPRRFAKFRSATLPERLVREGRPFAVHVLPADTIRAERNPWKFTADPAGHWGEYALILGVVAAITALGLLLPHASHLSIGLIYLLAVIVVSLRVGRGPVLLAGVATAITWEYIFIPPRFAFAIDTAEDGLLFGTYFVVALVAGQLTARVRAQARNERMREERATALLQLTRILAEATSFDAAVAGALRQVETLFNASTTLSLVDEAEHKLRAHAASAYGAAGAEAEAMEWAWRHAQPAGRFAAKTVDAAGYYLPLLLESGVVGVLGVKVSPQDTLVLGQRDLIEAFAGQLALLVERERLRAASEREALLAASEKLHRSLLDSVSHELRTPLAVIDAAIDGLTDADTPGRAKFVDEIRIAGRRLNRLVRNLLDQTRLESGALKPRLDWCSARDLANAAIDGTRDALAGHPITVVIADDLPPIRTDFALTEHALMNLLLNAALHTPPQTPVLLSAGLEGDRAYFEVADRGPGFPPSLRDRLFKKFSRGEGARAGGLGLGLSIVRGLINAQGGDVVVGENPGGGARVRISLPHPAIFREPRHE
jgi:two-component system, OmpR family, sensor histidine kinase KdpD